ncbi:MAG: hypothetical protein KAR05_07960 [Candidatus Omnitrophica bacterium]|nr:hypothetical protein [Candidatus Omnitrophota bacterium]
MKQFLALIILVLLLGCTAVSSEKKSLGVIAGRQQQAETSKEVEEAISSVISSMSGRDINHDDMKELMGQLRRDDEAKEAVEVITEGIVNKGIKYCPVTGKRYSPQTERCPEHDVLLKWVDDQDY